MNQNALLCILAISFIPIAVLHAQALRGTPAERLLDEAGFDVSCATHTTLAMVTQTPGLVPAAEERPDTPETTAGLPQVQSTRSRFSFA